METTIREQNKSLLKALVKNEFPKDFSYAERIVNRMRKKGLIITRQMVYQTVAGNSYNAQIAWHVMVLIRGYRIYNARINRELLKLANV
ncbi:hypothetical protein [Fibrella forsythiae]|uniref:Uncharacterized protein n=1 Tax=Fibrella forsythiae TaxID=2817061 RepID=A0ABS3JLI0_9BACT|nr:hypothetical protein [Fibrella forsythiae]MBO0950855.1 hypothetical protein [Fibrella forsythiae]